MGSNTFDWDAPQFQNSSYIKFEREGDTVEGVIVGMSSKTFPAKGAPGDKDFEPEKTYPVLCIDTANGERELTVSNVDLLQKTRAANPQEGDWYSAAYIATAGKKKIFLVKVTKAPSPVATHHPANGHDTRLDPSPAATVMAVKAEDAQAHQQFIGEPPF